MAGATWTAYLGAGSWADTFRHEEAGSHHPPVPSLDAREILRQRYARGEIDMPTFEHMRERLEAPTERERPPA
ncbi:MAG TPA: hypothetical protein VFV38_08565 [Ktedonobacteraceae bacterium]|nr:hypothetical protein [Ktedonobacteraceae bacterium]